MNTTQSKITWDYTNAAKNYNQRPQYPNKLIDKILTYSGLNENNLVCDIGSGTGYLSTKLAGKNLVVTAIEPNDAMRSIGIRSTKSIQNINWVNATAENSAQPDNYFDLVSYGSSFNVTDRLLALEEAKRIVKPQAWFLAIWNHRDLKSSLQAKIENCIVKHIPNYDYGTRRENQSDFLEQSQMFTQIIAFEENFKSVQTVEQILMAWKSHQTLINQAGSKFKNIINDIELLLSSLNSDTVETPYTSRAWLAQFK